ncbi:MAG: endolytic transglycosylase MltG [Candidatus Paceibacterota bacterium]|jgi:UPF0755 protein
MNFFTSHKEWCYSFIIAVLLVVGYSLTLAPPSDFPSRSIAVVARGAVVSEVATELADARIIAHPTLLRFVLRVSGQSARVQAGAYLFNTPENLLTVAWRLATGDFGLPPVRITFPEGETAREMSVRVNDAFPDISASDFLSAAQPYEGYLFPDTYLFLPSANAASIVAIMRENFNEKIQPLSGAIAESGHSLSDLVTMASLIEKEARSTAARRMVSGILWNRLARNMPLQVDAVFGYIHGRDTYSPSYADLKVDSPYNTYTHRGLPPGPISNPGMDSISAALYPTKTDYLYYLTGTDGLMHYATTYAGHQANQRKYLR